MVQWLGCIERGNRGSQPFRSFIQGQNEVPIESMLDSLSKIGRFKTWLKSDFRP